MRIQLNRFPNGLSKALTVSFDDGRDYDHKLVQKLNQYGIRGTFHLNSGKLGEAGHLKKEEIEPLFRGHEVSVHTVHHPSLPELPAEQVMEQIRKDRLALEELIRYPVKGMSYPYGAYNTEVVALVKAAGMEYARTVNSHGSFHLPEDWLRWHPTCHHKEMVDYADRFIERKSRHTGVSLFYVWGHSYEFEEEGQWDLVDRFGEKIGGRSDIWYATNAEIVSYCQAVERLRVSADNRILHNPSAQSVWVSVEGAATEVPGGQMLLL
ncbi:polysaccharide deacetylase [Paenibacillus yonginensis]|uniref:Polysaccharide deacetylase n=1 Tax=Paenibacillus yonginensis TaxID=1462996 RepID=A0A1B1MYY6_9BACL|nr:polysaccharide deacetylase family protein [Paenibacillus yonginensis]ANS74392.1 polysaccharide deacetylase [Paenibacillus yonginensis]